MRTSWPWGGVLTARFACPVAGLLWLHAHQGHKPWSHADVAQLVEHHLAKVRVAGSNPVVRSERVSYLCRGRFFTGGVAERRGNGLQIRVHGFKSRLHLGRLAQLVARFPDTEEVISSSLVPPTSRIRESRVRDSPGLSSFRRPTRTPLARPAAHQRPRARPRLPAAMRHNGLVNLAGPARSLNERNPGVLLSHHPAS